MKRIDSRLLPLLLCLAASPSLAAPPSEPEFESVTRRDYYDLLMRAEQALRDEKSSNVAELQQRLACAGNQPSQAALGGLYLIGRGVTKDDLTGYAWMKLAATSGEPRYRKVADTLEQHMTPEQRAAADAKFERLKSLYAEIPTHMTCSQVKAPRSNLKELRCEPEAAASRRSFVWLKRCAAEP